MIEVLAAATETAVQGPGVLQTWGPWGAVILALGGKEGIVAIISVLRGKKDDGPGDKYNKAACEQQHKAIAEQRMVDRTDLLYIRGRVDMLVEHLLEDGKK